ncbi:MAG: SusC/RagA family TonB-linked outer membrane protein [Balneolales bacterium]|nr:SusC/RagA family TonB-linked outer membrane protein [Balneolales bacterium]
MKKKLLKTLGFMSQLVLTMMLIFAITANVMYANTADAQNIKAVFVQVESQKATVSELFKLVEEQTEFSFLYNPNLLRNLDKELLNHEQETSLFELLVSVSNQTGLWFRQINSTIAVNTKNVWPDVSLEEIVKPDIEISGRVIDAETKQPLIGVNLLVEGTGIGTATNDEGYFELSVPDDATTLIVSYLGFITQEVFLTTETEYLIELVPDSEFLDEVVVVAYGVQRKSDVTGSISSAREDDFNKGVVANPGQLLQGVVAGVNVTNVSGEPGAAQNVIIRGVGSLRSGTTPLYVIDGFVLDNTSTGVANNPFNFINPNDIQSIEILKDASAAALYGARASNGVVVITTKKAQRGVSSLMISTSAAISSIANKMDVFTANQFRTQVPAVGGTLVDQGANTDWQDELTQNAMTQNINASMSGGASNNFNYFASVGVQSQEGILQNNDLNRYSGRLNLSQTALKGRLNVDYHLNAVRTENLRPDNSAMVVDMLQLNPTIPVFTNGEPTLLDEMLNPVLRYDIYLDEAINNRILANISPSLEIVNGLVYKLNIGVDYSVTNRDVQYMPYQLLEGFETGRLTTSNIKNTNQLIENTLSYKLENGVHNATILAGHSYQQFEYDGTSISQEGFTDNGIEPRYQDQVSTESMPTTISSAASKDELQSFFGRLDYAFDGKYLATATFRADGSSKFGSNNRYGYFPSFALGWNIAREDFLASDFINTLKLRASWGQTGNQEIPGKITQASFTESRSNDDTYPLDPDDENLEDYPYGTIFTRLANPDLQWEVSTQTNVGVDFEFFDYRIFGSVEYYNKVSDNILLEVVPADPIQPTSTYWTNINDMEIQNSGLELTLQYRSPSTSAFKYSIGGNLSTINNEVVNSPFEVLTTGAASGAGQTGATINGYINGEPIGAFYMLEFNGIGGDGLNSFVDQDGNGEILENDRVVVGSALPKLLYGIQLNFEYNDLGLSLNFNGASGHKIYNHTAMSLFSNSNLANNFNTTDFATEFANEDITNSNTVSTRYLEDGDYLRLNNATLSYNIKPSLIGLQGVIQNARLTVTGQNLFVISGYSGFDPEVNTGSSTGGIQTFGIDRFTYPSARTFMFGLDVSF